jgi:polyhydroxybutyrate depolymerase
LRDEFLQTPRSIFCRIDRKDAPTAPVVEIDMLRPEGLRHYLQAVPTGPVAGMRPMVVLRGSGASAAQVQGMAFPPSPLSVSLEISQRERWS